MTITKIIFLLAPILFLQDVKNEEIVLCIGKKYSINMSKTGYTKSIDQYMEGQFINYTYNDSSAITIHCGYNISKPLLSKTDYILNDSIFSNGFSTRRGIERISKRYWQESAIGDVTIMFTMVKEEDLESFKNSIASFKEMLKNDQKGK